MINEIVVTKISEDVGEIQTGTMCVILSNPNQVEISAHINDDGIVKLRFTNPDGTPKKLYLDCHPLGLRDLRNF
jgi:hypothetical protein